MKQQVVTFNNKKNAETMHTMSNEEQKTIKKEEHNNSKKSRAEKLFELVVNNDRRIRTNKQSIK